MEAFLSDHGEGLTMRSRKGTASDSGGLNEWRHGGGVHGEEA